MRADSCFRIGSTRKVCEDFALSHNAYEKSFAIISDGSSDSSRTDFGARFLSLAAEQTLLANGTAVDKSDDLHYIMLKLASCMSKISGLPDSCLDATLGYVHFSGSYIKAFLAGDGAIIARKRNGDLWASVINYDTDAPPYLSYGLDKKRRELFLDKTDKCKYTINTYSTAEGGVLELVNTEDMKGMEPHYYIFEQDEYDMVMVVSDGIYSFKRLISYSGLLPTHSTHSRYYQHMPVNMVIPHLANIGSFLNIKELCTIKKCKHFNDLSIATIYC